MLLLENSNFSRGKRSSESKHLCGLPNPVGVGQYQLALKEDFMSIVAMTQSQKCPDFFDWIIISLFLQECTNGLVKDCCSNWTELVN